MKRLVPIQLEPLPKEMIEKSHYLQCPIPRMPTTIKLYCGSSTVYTVLGEMICGGTNNMLPFPPLILRLGKWKQNTLKKERRGTEVPKTIKAKITLILSMRSRYDLRSCLFSTVLISSVEITLRPFNCDIGIAELCPIAVAVFPTGRVVSTHN